MKEETLDEIVAIIRTTEEEIEFCDKIDAAVVKRIAYDRIKELIDKI